MTCVNGVSTSTRTPFSIFFFCELRSQYLFEERAIYGLVNKVPEERNFKAVLSKARGFYF